MWLSVWVLLSLIFTTHVVFAYFICCEKTQIFCWFISYLLYISSLFLSNSLHWMLRPYVYPSWWRRLKVAPAAHGDSMKSVCVQMGSCTCLRPARAPRARNTVRSVFELLPFPRPPASFLPGAWTAAWSLHTSELLALLRLRLEMQQDSLARGIPKKSVPDGVLTQNVLGGCQAQDLKKCQERVGFTGLWWLFLHSLPFCPTCQLSLECGAALINLGRSSVAL